MTLSPQKAADTAARDRPSGWRLALTTMVLVLIEKMLAHSYYVTIVYGDGNPEHFALWKFLVPGAVGLAGVWMIWTGLKRDDVKASLLGFLGASLMWTSFVEVGLAALAQANHIPMVLDRSVAVGVSGSARGLMGEHVIHETAIPFALLTFLLIGMNKDTRCRLILWVRAMLRLSPGKPTPRYQPQYAMVTAREYFYVNWFLYGSTVLLVDPRLLGATHPVTYAVGAIVAIWGAWLLFVRLPRIREAGLSIRYAVAAVGISWLCFELPVLWGWYKEPWVWYWKFPGYLFMPVAALVFGLAIRSLWRAPAGGGAGTPA